MRTASFHTLFHLRVFQRICCGFFHEKYACFTAATYAHVEKNTTVADSPPIVTAIGNADTLIDTIGYMWLFNVPSESATSKYKPSYRRDSARRRSLHRSRSFKVTDFGTNRKHLCEFLRVDNSADNGSAGHGSNRSTNVNGSRGSRVSTVKHLTR